VYIGKIRLSPTNEKLVSKRDYTNENIKTFDGNWQPIVSMELWDKVQDRLLTQRQSYRKYEKAQQPVQHLLKGLVKCDSCGGTLSMSSCVSGKNKTRTLQCSNYSRGRCLISHSVTIPKLETAVIQGLKQAVKDKTFTLAPTPKKKIDMPSIDYGKLIAIEERKLARAKEAYLAEIDTIEQYKQNKTEITERIEELKARQKKDTFKEIDVKAFAKKVSGIVKFIERDDVSVTAKNEALRTIIEKAVYEKSNGNVAIYFHDI
jgi:hypothetical protein